MDPQRLLQVNTVAITFQECLIIAGTSLIFLPMEVIDYGIDPVGGIDYFNMFIQHILRKIDSVR